MDFEVACDACGNVFEVDHEPDLDTEYLCEECDDTPRDWDVGSSLEP